MRRKRSHLSITDCLRVFSEFSSKVQRQMETSADPFEFQGLCQSGRISVVFQVNGGFGVADDLFEAIRVLRGVKLPRKAPK